jgi:hypothetical protein
MLAEFGRCKNWDLAEIGQEFWLGTARWALIREGFEGAYAISLLLLSSLQLRIEIFTRIDSQRLVSVLGFVRVLTFVEGISRSPSLAEKV